MVDLYCHDNDWDISFPFQISGTAPAAQPCWPAGGTGYLHDGPCPRRGAVVVVHVVGAALGVLALLPARGQARRGVHVGHRRLLRQEIIEFLLYNRLNNFTF